MSLLTRIKTILRRHPAVMDHAQLDRIADLVAPLSRVTTDPTDPRLGHGVDLAPVDQHEAYLVVSAEERAAGFVRPVRRSYIHEKCGASTRMGLDIAETYAQNPTFYGATYCCACNMHRPVGEAGEFVWEDGTKVGT